MKKIVYHLLLLWVFMASIKHQAQGQACTDFAVIVGNWGDASLQRFDGTTGNYSNQLATGIGAKINSVLQYPSPNGNIYLGGYQEVNVVNAFTGAVSFSFTGGSLSGLTEQIVVGLDGKVYVANEGTSAGLGSIARFDANTGVFIDNFISFPSYQPNGLAQDAAGNWYVSTRNSPNQVLKYNSSGVLQGIVTTMGTTQTGGGLKVYNNELYVVTTDSPQTVKVYSLPVTSFPATPVRTLNTGGTTYVGIAFGPDNNMYMADFYNSRVSVWNPTTGTLVRNLTNASIGNPHGVGFTTCTPCTPPTVGTPVATQATCTGSTANNDAKIDVTGISGGDKYSYGTDTTAFTYASATAYSGSTINITGLANPSAATTYYVRVYNGSGLCFKTVSVVLANKACCIKPNAGLDQNLSCGIVTGQRATSLLTADISGGVWSSPSADVSLYSASSNPTFAYIFNKGVFPIIYTVGGCSDTLTVTFQDLPSSCTDTWVNFATPKTVNAVTTNTNQYATIDDVTNIIGGELDITLKELAGNGGSGSNVDIYNGVLTWNHGPSRFSNLTLDWDGNDNDAAVFNPTGLGGLNLSGAGKFQFIINSVDVAKFNIKLRLYTDATNISESTFSMDQAGNLNSNIPVVFNTFSVVSGTGANLANIGAIQLLFSPKNLLSESNGIDMELACFKTPCLVQCVKPVIGATTSTQATCTGSVANNDAKIDVTGIAGGDKYSYGTDSTSFTYASATAFSGASINITGLANPSTATTYYVRVYNGSDVCYKTVSVVLQPKTCLACPNTTYPLCAGESYTLSTPAGMTNVQWYKNGVAIVAPTGTATSLMVTTIGDYVYTGLPSGGTCKDSLCCPVKIVAGTNCCVKPTLGTAVSTQATCTGSVANSDAKIDVSGISGGDKYVYGTDSTSFTYTAGTSFTGSSISITGLANPSTATTYYVRVYNGSDACYKTVSVVIQSKTCVVGCTTPIVATLTATPATCNGAVANSDAKLNVTGISGGDKYSYGTSTSSFTYAAAVSLTGSSLTIGGIANPTNATIYYVRIYNGTNSCFTDMQVTLLPTNCTTPCGTPNCLSIGVKKN